jgi:hypothetical protein
MTMYSTFLQIFDTNMSRLFTVRARSIRRSRCRSGRLARNDIRFAGGRSKAYNPQLRVQNGQACCVSAGDLAHVGSSQPHTPLHLEMRALDRRARTDMILYTGQFGHNGSAASAVHVNIITGTP